MNLISEIMSTDVKVLKPDNSLQTAAQLMSELNVGGIPVCDGDKLIGMVTDRDIAIRGVAYGKDINKTTIKEVMSSDVHWCFDDQQIEEVSEKMSDIQIRRIPVMNRQKKLVGIVSLGDIAAKHSSREAAETLKDISYPAKPATPSSMALQ
ncbi:MAG: CBS domain-containing protein [Pseudomonadota bacterium]